MTRFRQCVWLVGLMLLLPGAGGPTQAQGPHEGWQVYTNANYVNDLALEGGGALGGGYTWAATDGGVVCYSASQQVKFTTADGLPCDPVHAIAIDSSGWLWFGTSCGVSVLDDDGTPFDKDDDTWATFTTVDGLAGNSVFRIAVDSGDRLWLGTNSGVSMLDNGGTPFDKADDTWTTFTAVDGLVSHYVRAIAAGGENRLWFGTNGGGVSVLDHGGTAFDKNDDTWASFTTADGLASDYVWAIAVDSGSRLWFGTPDGASVLDDSDTPFDKNDDTCATFNVADGLASNFVRAIAMDSGGRLWFGTEGNGVSMLDHGGTPFDKRNDTWTSFTTADGLADNRIEVIVVEGGNRLWFGTYDGGASVLDHGATPFDKDDDTWTTFTTGDGLADSDVYAIAADSGGRLWFGTPGGVSVLDHGGTPFDKGDDNWSIFTTADGLASDYVRAIAVDSGNRLWFGTFGGVSVLNHGGTPFDKDDDTWISFTTTHGLASDNVQAIAVDGGGRLWFGTSDGASVLDDGDTPSYKGDDTWATFTDADVLPHNYVQAIAMDGGGRLWFGTRDGVSVLDDGGTPFDNDDDTWATFPSADGVANSNVYAITIDSGNRLWFGTGVEVGTRIGGVNMLDYNGTPFDKGDDIWATFTAADGLNGNNVHSIVEDDNGRLWFGAWWAGIDYQGAGVSVLDNGHTPFDKEDDTWITFTTADGLADDGIKAIAVDSREWLWFGDVAAMWHGIPDLTGVSMLVDTVAPISSASDSIYTNSQISVPWSASDGASHIFRVTLWVKHDGSGAWTSTGLSQRGQITGTLTYTPTYGDGTYSFATVAEDWMGNVEATPAGRGDCSTCVGRCPVYLPVVLRNYRTWDAYYEENDHWLDAYGPLASGKVYLAYPDDTDDYYYFVLSAPATVTVSATDFAPTSSNGTVMLYGPAVGSERGNLIDYYGPPGDSSMSLGPHSLGPGKYYVRVYTENYHSTVQRYRLEVTY